MNKWISVNDRLPETPNGQISRPVLVVMDGGSGTEPRIFITMMWHKDHASSFDWECMESRNCRVTHWMPLPDITGVIL